MKRFAIVLASVCCFASISMAFADSSSFGDVKQAQSFLASLPPSCTGSYSVASDGRVSVSYSCKNKSGQVESGTIGMKDGKVVDIK